MSADVKSTFDCCTRHLSTPPNILPHQATPLTAAFLTAMTSNDASPTSGSPNRVALTPNPLMKAHSKLPDLAKRVHAQI